MTFTGPVEDRIAIRELIERYADAVNRADAEAWGATWAADGVWSLPGIAEVAGRDAIVAAWRAAMAQFAGVVFLAMPGAIEIDGDHATARSYTSETYEAGGTVHRDCGRYDDALARRDGQWRFTRRAFRHLHRD
jgi:uncharacterized protein (TIGR02246 family)